MLLRCQAGKQWFTPARVYAQWILNRIITKPNGQTRFQKYLSKIPDLNKRTRFLFLVPGGYCRGRAWAQGQLDGSLTVLPPRQSRSPQISAIRRAIYAICGCMYV